MFTALILFIRSYIQPIIIDVLCSIYDKKNISKDTQEMPQSRSIAFPRHQKKERFGTNTYKTNDTYNLSWDLSTWITATLWLKATWDWLLYITKTYLYNFDPLKPHFYIVNMGFTGVYIIFHISAQNIDCGYSLEPHVLSRNIKNIRGFYLKFFGFLEVKFSTYLHRRVFVMKAFRRCKNSLRKNVYECSPLLNAAQGYFVYYLLNWLGRNYIQCNWSVTWKAVRWLRTAWLIFWSKSPLKIWAQLFKANDVVS